MINPVSQFYEYYLAVKAYAIPELFITFFGMSIAVYIFLALYQLFWKIR